jgi:hypothetical protein
MFLIQINEATDCNGISQFIAYVRLVEGTTICFCKFIKRRTTAKNSLKIVGYFVK